MKSILKPLLLSALCLITSNMLFAQQQSTVPSAKAHKSQLIFHGETAPLGEMAPTPVSRISKKEQRKKNRRARIPNFEYNVTMPNNNEKDALPKGGDPLRSSSRMTGVVVEPIINFEGMDEEDLLFVSVPDVNGDVGPNHYIETANTFNGAFYQVFDKDGVALTTASTMQDLWTPFNAIGLGDPVVIYDQAADRWLLSELSFDFSSMLIAVSSSPDPLGTWFVYEFQSPWGLPDYPKYGLGPDAYFCTTNEYIADGSDMDNHIPVYCFERDKMLTGDSDVGVQIVGIPKFGESGVFVFQTATAANWEGSNPYNPDAGHPIVRIYDDAWDGGVDKVEVWEVHVDWDNEDNTLIDGPIELPTAPFDADLCNGDIFNCITQSNGGFVSALQQVVMNRVTYRNFSTYEAMVMCLSVDVDAAENLAGVRWFELRRVPGGEWTLYQEGTVGQDENHRFMPTIGMDGGGNIALGYSMMGPDNFLSLRYTGRRTSDPLGEMTVEEYESATGLSFHDEYTRWGDYFSMSVDPVDQTTFWFAGQYAKEDNLWSTKVTTFQVRRDTNDVGPFRLDTPQNSAFLSNAENIVATYKNYGYSPQSNIEVGYIFENGATETKIITGPLEPDSTYEVAFDNTVDMDIIKAYEFKLFTGLLGDENSFNDTLVVSVSKLPRWDAGVTGFPDIGSGLICDTIYNTDISFSNFGVDPLTSVTVFWQLNGGPTNSFDWTGNLLTGESDAISVTLDPLLDGTNTLLSFTDMPSGMTDQTVANDTIERTFIASTEGRTITLVLETDFYPNETSWDLETQDGTVIYSGGPYSNGNSVIQEEWCLPLDCYVFKLYDTFGDGIFVPGGYQILDDDGTVLAETINPDFGNQETNEFCVEFQCLLATSTSVSVETSLGAGDGAIIINTSNGAAPFEYLLNGSNAQSSPIFDNLSAGFYTIVVIDANACIVEADVEVPLCAISFTATSEDVTSIGAADGSIVVNVSSGNPPYQYSIDNGNNFQSEPLFENLTSGIYTLLIQDNFGCQQSLEIEVGITSGTKETIYGIAITVRPNPTDGYFQIDVAGISDQGFIYYDVMDASGKIVQRARLAPFNNIHTGRVTIVPFPDGIYFVRFHHEQLRQAVRVVKKS